MIPPLLLHPQLIVLKIKVIHPGGIGGSIFRVLGPAFIFAAKAKFRHIPFATIGTD
jgi:hypothetical protein